MAKLRISRRNSQILAEYVRQASGEISGLGIVAVVADGLEVVHWHLLPQRSGQASTDIDQGAVADLLADIVEVGGDTAYLKVHWHSHGQMGVFWSTTDNKTAEGFLQDWSARIVTNQKGEFLAALEIRHPVAVSVPLDVMIYDEALDEETVERIKKEVKEKNKPSESKQFGTFVADLDGRLIRMEDEPKLSRGERKQLRRSLFSLWGEDKEIGGEGGE